MKFIEILESLTEAEGTGKKKCQGCKKTITSMGECPHCGKYNHAFDTKKKRGGGTESVFMRNRKIKD